MPFWGTGRHIRMARRPSGNAATPRLASGNAATAAVATRATEHPLRVFEHVSEEGPTI